MPADDTLVVVADHLSVPVAGMLRGLLDSAGITGVILDDPLAGTTVGIGYVDAKLAVRGADAQRAKEILAVSGSVAGSEPDEPVEIPESEWSRPAVESPGERELPPATTARPRISMIRSGTSWPVRVLGVLLIVLALATAMWIFMG